MSKIDIKQHIIPAYLAIVLLMQIKTDVSLGLATVNMILMILVPILIISISIHLKNRNLGMIGMFFFYIVSLPQILVTTMEDFQVIFLEMFLMLIPSIMLVSQILQLGNKENLWFILEKKKPFILSSLLVVIILFVFYLLTVLFGEGLILSMENVEGQVFLLAAISLAICTPLLLRQKNL